MKKDLQPAGLSSDEGVMGDKNHGAGGGIDHGSGSGISEGGSGAIEKDEGYLDSPSK